MNGIITKEGKLVLFLVSEREYLCQASKNKNKKGLRMTWWDNTVKDILSRENSVIMASCCSKKKAQSVWQGAGEGSGEAQEIDWGQIPKTYYPLPRNLN